MLSLTLFHANLHTREQHNIPISCWDPWCSSKVLQASFEGFCSSSLKPEKVVDSKAQRRTFSLQWFLPLHGYLMHSFVWIESWVCCQSQNLSLPWSPSSCILYGGLFKFVLWGVSRAQCWQDVPDTVLVKEVPLNSVPFTLFLHSVDNRSTTIHEQNCFDFDPEIFAIYHKALTYQSTWG